jgi:hypothetical protein
MATRVTCDLCQGPIEPDTLRGCVHLPKLITFKEPESFAEAVHQQQQRTMEIRGRHYIFEDLDICEGCVRMLKGMRRMHPCGRVG